MSAPVLPVALGYDFKSPNPATDWCIAHSSIDPSRKRIPKKKTGGAVEKHSPLIDVTFWAKKSRVDQEQLTCLNDSGKERSGVRAKNLPNEGEERLENAGGDDGGVIKEQIPLPKERPNHPRWNPKGSTIVRVDGRDIDLAALPECSCRPFFVNYQQRRIQHNRKPQDVTEESVEEAHRIRIEKEVACLFCRERYWSGFPRMRQIALERQFQAQLPPELRLKRRRCLNAQQ